MSRKKVRLDEWEANRLSNLFEDEVVVIKDGNEGRVTKVTKGGIQVLLPKSKTIRPYPLYDSFIKGDLRFRDKNFQEEMMHSLKKAAGSVGIATPSEVELAAKEPTEPHVSHIDVPGNIRLVLFFKNVDEEKYLFHMKHVGFSGFDKSIDEGVKEDPFAVLRETSYYLGCSVGLLLSTYDEFLQLIFRECTAASGWNWIKPKSDRMEDGKSHLSVHCKNRDNKRDFTVHAIYVDDGLVRCQGIQINLAESLRELFELHTMQCAVLNPSHKTIRAFSDVYRAAGGIISIAASTTSKASSAAKPVVESTRGKATASLSSKSNPTMSPNQQAKPIHVNEFLVRRSYGSHRTNGHSLESIRATVSILPKSGGSPRPVEFNAYWCPKCRKHFMDEETYLNLKRQGYICCKVVEEKDLGTKKVGDGLYGNLASESVLHMYGYTVNQQDDLSEAERRTIISFVIENHIQTAQDIAHLLEWLISQRENNPRMSVAISRWKADLRFVKRYNKPTRVVRVDRIYAKI